MNETAPKPPAHRFEATFVVGANSMEELADRLYDIATELDHDSTERARQVFGGGYCYDIAFEPDVTAESYRAALSAWHKASKNGGAA